MAGGTQLGGHIFVGADKTLQMLGTARDRSGEWRDRQHAWAMCWVPWAREAALASAIF